VKIDDAEQEVANEPNKKKKKARQGRSDYMCHGHDHHKESHSWWDDHTSYPYSRISQIFSVPFPNVAVESHPLRLQMFV
jgi:hypothetical protein